MIYEDFTSMKTFVVFTIKIMLQVFVMKNGGCS